MSEERNPNQNRNRNRVQDSNTWVGIILRLLLSAIVIAVAAFLTPGFTIRGLWGIILAAVAITLINYLIERFAGIDASPFGRGIVGFVIAAIVIYVTQFIVPDMRVTPIGAFLGAIVIGIIDYVVPGRTM